MELIEFKNLPDTSTPINAENLNNNFNELNKSNTYSTEEKVVGTWIDGTPLYRKVITGSTGTGTNLSANITKPTNFKKFVNSYGNYTNGDGTNYAFGSNSDAVIYAGEQIQIYWNNIDTTQYTYELVIEYTKTTD